MKLIGKRVTVLIGVLLLLTLTVYSPSTALAQKAKAAKAVPQKAQAANPDASETWSTPNAKFDAGKMGDMSGWDPANWVNPEGDTIKIAVFWPHSGAAAENGELGWACVSFAAYDINQRGGIFVDGKKKKIALYKADSMSKQDQAKKICERMALQEKVHVIIGTSGSNMMKIANEVGNRYKVITQNVGALADELQDATNFGRYAFMSSDSTFSIGRGMAYYYGQIRKKEKKFYILCQDYSFGHDMAEGFKTGLKQYYPEAQIVGEDYHKLFITDFAPYLEKIKASGAEVVWTGDWMPDGGNVLKQARQMGIKLPFANLFMDEPNSLHEVGIEGTKGLVNIKHFEKAGPQLSNPGYIKYYKAWNNQWKKWNTPPFNRPLYEHGTGTLGHWTQQVYWLFSVIERAKSTDAEKIIKVWEGDTYQYVNGRIIKMRACDHKAIQGFRVAEYVGPEEQKVSMNIPPYYWFKKTSGPGPAWEIPAEKVLPWMDPKLERCAGKNDWGE
jgi:ABC-type branched-subunit amino acid transport system substrate-binding protein